jgi:DNA polymerase-3 subunit delta
MKDNLFFIYGDESFLLNRKVKEISTGFLGEKFAEGAFEILDGETLPLTDIMARAASLSMFFPERVVLVKNWAPKKGRGRGKKADPQLAAFAAALKLIPDETCVIFVHQGSRIEKSGLYACLLEQAVVYEFKRYAEWQQAEVVEQVLQLFAEEKAKVKPETARYLVELVGHDLQTLNSEIQKLVNFVAAEQEIMPADIEKMVSPGRVEIFKLVDLVFARQKKAALQLMQKLLDLGEDPLSLMAVLSSGFRMLLQARLLAAAGHDAFSVAQRLGASPHYVKKVLRDGKRYSPEELTKILLMLHEADCKMKQGFNKETCLAVLVLDICAPSSVRKALS